MPKKIPAGAVPALQLTPQDERELRQLSAQLQHEILAQYEAFLFRDKRSIDSSKWKLLKSDGDLHAYKERHVKQRHRRNSALSEVEPGPQEKLVQHSLLPRLLVTGMIPGTVDDIMYGMSFQDSPSLQAFWAARRSIEECAVVAKLDGHTGDDPYRFLGVTWFLRAFPLNIIQRRDFLGLSYTGMTRLSNGERVGISFDHSIEHRDLAELYEFDTIRVKSSTLKIYRQFDANRVEVFMPHFLDKRGSLPDHSHAQESLVHLMPLMASACDTGFRKKLEWLVHRRKHDHLDATLCDAIEPQSSGTNDYCEVCEKRLRTLFSSRGTSCELCYQRVCGRCSMSHDLVVPMTTGMLTPKAHDFCVQCLLKARSMSTLTIALNVAQNRRSTSGLSSSKPPSRALTTLLLADSLRSTDGAVCVSYFDVR